TPRRLLWLAVPVVLVAAIVVLRLAGERGGPQRAGREPAVVVATDATAVGTPKAPTNAVAGVPSGFRHDKSGAIAAALGFLAAGPSVVAMDDDTAVAAQRLMSTAESAQALVADLRARLAAMHDGF